MQGSTRIAIVVVAVVVRIAIFPCLQYQRENVAVQGGRWKIIIIICCYCVVVVIYMGIEMAAATSMGKEMLMLILMLVLIVAYRRDGR